MKNKQFEETEAEFIESESWVGYNSTSDADYFKTKHYLWVRCPFCGREFNPEYPFRACAHFVNFAGNSVLFQNLEDENDEY